MSKECNHPTCGETCRRPKKEKTRSFLKRTPIKKKPYKLRKFSKKRARVNTRYNDKARAFREKHPVCLINSPECTNHTQGVHHVRGKSTQALLMDENNWLPACNPCNTYIEAHSEWAQENGFKKSKHN